MSRVRLFAAQRAGRLAGFAAVLVCAAASAQADEGSASSTAPIGRVDFAAVDLPPATVEVDLSREMFRDLFGLGDAAIAGVAESLLKSAGSNSDAQGTRMAAEQLAAAQQIIRLASEVVHEVRVRVYENVEEGAIQPDELMANFDGQLRDGNWENVVRVRDGDDNVRVSLLRNDGAVRGAFVVVADGSDVVLANVVADISPENVKKLTSAAAQIGLENGLQQVLEQKMRELPHRLPPGKIEKRD